MKKSYIRKEVYPISLVFKKIGDNGVIKLGDDIMNMSQRYRLFKKKGCECVICGIKGQFFAKEQHKCNLNNINNKYHLNLYAINKFGDEILMTKDHIIPKSKGGKNGLKNLQVLCEKCNSRKGNRI